MEEEIVEKKEVLEPLEPLTFEVKDTSKVIKATKVQAVKQQSPAPQPQSDVRSLAECLKEKLIMVNFCVNPTVQKFPYVEFSSDFGDCSALLTKVKTEVKLRCYVEKGYASEHRMHSFTKKALSVVSGKHKIGNKCVSISRAKTYQHSMAGTRYSTLFLNVVLV